MFKIFKIFKIYTIMASLYLQKFYADYYHPSNARFWFYGDDPGGCLLTA